MRRIILAAILIATFLLPSMATASHPIRECNMGYDGSRWYYGADQSRIQGYGARNFTTRVATCRTAPKVFRATRRIQADSQAEYVYKAKRLRAAGRRWRCVDVRPGYESSDMRCTARGHRVVRWQEGS